MSSSVSLEAMFVWQILFADGKLTIACMTKLLNFIARLTWALDYRRSSLSRSQRGP